MYFIFEFFYLRKCRKFMKVFFDLIRRIFINRRCVFLLCVWLSFIYVWKVLYWLIVFGMVYWCVMCFGDFMCLLLVFIFVRLFFVIMKESRLMNIFWEGIRKLYLERFFNFRVFLWMCLILKEIIFFLLRW